MVTLKGTFDASQYESAFTLIDPGRYVAIVKDSELLQRSDGATGVTLKFEIQSGDFNGAVHSENYTIFSAPKEEHLQFARQAFARVCDACNMSLVQDTAQLHNIPIGIEIGNGKPWTDREGNQRESRRLVRGLEFADDETGAGSGRTTAAAKSGTAVLRESSAVHAAAGKAATAGAGSVQAAVLIIHRRKIIHHGITILPARLR